MFEAKITQNELPLLTAILHQLGYLELATFEEKPNDEIVVRLPFPITIVVIVRNNRKLVVLTEPA